MVRSPTVRVRCLTSAILSKTFPKHFLDNYSSLSINGRSRTVKEGKNFTGPFILAYCPLKICCPAATVTLVPCPYWPSIILPLSCHVLLCLTSVITVLRCRCMLSRFGFVISQMLQKQQVVHSISTLVSTVGNQAKFDHSLTQIYRRPTWRHNRNSLWYHKAGEKKEDLRTDGRVSNRSKESLMN